MTEFQQATAPDTPDSDLRQRGIHWWLWLHVLQREALREFDPDQWQQLYGVTEQTAHVEDD